MGVRVESMHANDAHVSLIPPGEDWVGQEDQGDDEHVLAISCNEVTAIHGSVAELQTFAISVMRAAFGHIDLVIKGHGPRREFVEIEDEHGRSFEFGRWLPPQGEYQRLRLTDD